MQTKTLAYSLGLDIGIASVGWCVLGENRIIDLGVRAFDKAETADKGEPLNLTRRTARLTRRRLRRRAWRLVKLARLLKHIGLVDDVRKPQQFATVSPWQLRVDGLDRRLSNDEWACILYHLCKHRGFHWISRAEEKKAEGDKKEGGKVIQALSDTASRMEKYRSAAEMVLTEFPEAQRNKAGNYGKSLSRLLLADELHLLFERQRAHGNPHADTKLQQSILDRKSGLFWAQHPALSGQQMLERIGRCTFERPGGPDGKGEYRAPKASFTAERHVWLTRLNNLRIVVDGETRPLNSNEHRLALPLPYGYANAELSYKQLRTALTKAGLSQFNFAGIAEDKEKNTLIKLPAWEILSKTLKGKNLDTEWQGMAGAATGGDPTLLDEIARILSIYKDGAEVEGNLRKLALPGGEKMIEGLSEISFDKFHALSLKALRKIVPHMEAGLRYDEAVAAIPEYGHHSQLNKSDDEKELYLPPLYESARSKKPGETGKLIFSERIDSDVSGGIPRNPVVLRAINQARKVVNAIIRRHGSPQVVHIEMARDLSRPLKGHWNDRGDYIRGRLDIQKEQAENRARNEADWQEFSANAPMMGATGEPKGRDFEKWQLYREQDGKCPYCQKLIDIDRLLERGYVEVDHALPRSRSFDNGKRNKVLVHIQENQEKGNRTPYEYFKDIDACENGHHWQAFVSFVASNPKYRREKKNILCRKNFGDKEAKEFRERNLYDTRYICRFFKNYVERYLQLADDSDAKRCIVVSGQLTAFLRARWGLPKVRSQSDRHHALDATVVAACSHGMVKRLTDYSRRKEIAQVRDGFVDAETGEIIDTMMFQQLHAHFPDPWPHFRHELEARLKINDPVLLRTEMERLGSYSEEALQSLRPLFVSRAPQRRNGGALHEETIRSATLIGQEKSHVRTPLQKLKLASLDKIIGAHDPRNASMIALLRERLKQYEDDGKKAFAEPIYKPSNSGRGAVIKAVKLASTQKSGMWVRGGVAEMGEMHHVDIFKHGHRYHVEPAYLASPTSRINPPNVPEGAELLFALSKNDYVKISLGNVSCEGYFVMYESDGRITLRAHDQPKPDKEYFRKSIASASKIEKFHVDVLGNLFLEIPEQRHGLA